jgi:hypothetical protein
MPEPARSFPTLETFYAADPRRRESPERDIGLAWRGARGATYRAAWIQATEEVYLVRHGHPAEGGGTVEVLRRRFRLRELAAAFRGYRDVVGRRGSLSWLRERTTMPPAAPA